ncbi:MAG: HAD family hydrolase [Chloroflexi bacterium]|uniref:HAD family hydrolase n=1 Tax=Candidatus Chlorohelix allophototropha TaxID=3003348 RepID=A0A8T7M746_9CHLR|nr:HAD family hydrolase [Chloroflexota bacterium]WJW69875.1 HAD family hydrolase [Chloroflexota bacterium L227-S17]
MSQPNQYVFLLDVDNTLLDTDSISADLRAYLEQIFSKEAQQRYWQIFDELREELGYSDHLGTLQRFRVENMNQPNLIDVSLYLLNYPFKARLFPGALELIERFRSWGTVVILTDGDAVYQPHKINCAGLLKAVNRKVLVTIHKEQQLDQVELRYPASHYIMVDDKLRLLTEIKKRWGMGVTTIFVRQGHYAHEPDIFLKYPPADLMVENLAALLDYDLELIHVDKGRSR